MELFVMYLKFYVKFVILLNRSNLKTKFICKGLFYSQIIGLTWDLGKWTDIPGKVFL
jgi:hypothetical protein